MITNPSLAVRANMIIEPIAKIHTDLPEKFGLPRQSGVVPELLGTIVFEKEYRNADALRGLDGYSHIWLIWEFSMGFASDGPERKWSPTVRPPRLGGNTRVGVFATRSPNRPNPLGLSVVKIESIENTDKYGTVIKVSRIDMADGTPIYDIKPYLPHVDSVVDATGGFATEVNGAKLTVSDPLGVLSVLSQDKRDALVALLKEDPHPSYKNDGERVYGLSYAGFEVSFRISDGIVTLTDIIKK